jgi:hypothetical protein
MSQNAPIEPEPENIQQRCYWAKATKKLRHCDGCRQRRAAIAKLLEQLGLPS